MQNRPTLTQYLIELQRQDQTVSANLQLLLEGVADACKIISHQVGQGALGGILGSLDKENVQGETQKKLDVIANQILLQANEWRGTVAAMASEELEEIYAVPPAYPQGEYLLLFDPLDGSSNIDVNVSIGTIFSILRCPSTATPPTEESFLQPGTQQVAAGYVVYGPQTVLVLSTGQGVHCFTLDRELGIWILTQRDLRIPETTQEFAINASNARHWHPPVKRYIDELLAGQDGVREQNFNMRWVASMVADVHRILNRGGIFMYPADQRDPSKPGRLRLMYEANPMAFLIEQAGGAATNGLQRILEVTPTHLHQRVAVLLGSKNEVERVTRYHDETQTA